MSNLSMVNAISVLPKLLSNLEHILRKAEVNAEERGIDPQIFLNARLAPDMWPLKKQVQVVASFVKMAPHRVVGTEPPSYEDKEETFEELYALLARAKADFDVVPSANLEGKEGREFTLKIGPREMEFTGISYVSGFSIPQIHFHTTTAYNILRHNGVPLGKFDYFGGGA